MIYHDLAVIGAARDGLPLPKSKLGPKQQEE